VEGKNTIDGNLISWKTGIETNNNHFIIERSEDGINWLTIGSINKDNTISFTHDYSYLDNSYSATTNYYRIVQVDNDGKKSISKTISIKVKNQFEVFSYPNPFSSSITLLVRSVEKEVTIKVISVLGVLIESKIIATNEESYFGEDYTSGTYFISIESETDAKRIRIVKN